MKYLFYLLVIAYIFTSCSKDNIDYRKPLCGKYKVLYTSYNWSIINDSTGIHNIEKTDTINSILTISKSKISCKRIDLSFDNIKLDTFFYRISSIESNENKEFILLNSPNVLTNSYSQYVYIKNDSIYVQEGAQYRTGGFNHILKGNKIN